MPNPTGRNGCRENGNGTKLPRACARGRARVSVDFCRILSIFVGSYRLRVGIVSWGAAIGDGDSERYVQSTRAQWIPAFAGMTWVGAGMTQTGMGMTQTGMGMTQTGCGNDVDGYGNDVGGCGNDVGGQFACLAHWGCLLGIPSVR